MKPLLKATISGSFKAGDNQIESYDKVTGIIPGLDDDKAQQMVIKRYARIWIGQAMRQNKDGTEEPRYKRVQRVREVFIDSVEEAEDLAGKHLSYVGKNVMDMSFEELQDLAAANDLSAVPLYKTGSLTNARRIAFAEYASKVLGWEEPNAQGITGPIDWRKEGFNPSKYEAIIADGEIRRSGAAPADIEETIDREALVLKGKMKPAEAAAPSRLTLNQLKEIAKAKNIAFNANIGYDALHKKIYKDAA